LLVEGSDNPCLRQEFHQSVECAQDGIPLPDADLLPAWWLCLGILLNWRSGPPEPPLSATRHPRYWSRSEISCVSRRSIRGDVAAASRPTRRFHRAETTSRRVKRDVELSLHLPQHRGGAGKSQRTAGSHAERRRSMLLLIILILLVLLLGGGGGYQA
jgi:hypothetical protein